MAGDRKLEKYKLDLRWISRKWDFWLWTGLSWLMIMW
jgi:hypothetical protein